jgi:hypothetical protein
MYAVMASFPNSSTIGAKVLRPDFPLNYSLLHFTAEFKSTNLLPLCQLLTSERFYILNKVVP